MINNYIEFALEEAKIAFENNEVPVGAVIVRNNEVIAKAHNMTRSTNNAINHAEILAITEASKILGDWRLNDCELYVTLEPCPMCAGAIVQSRIKKIYIGTTSNIRTNKNIVCDILNNTDYYHNVSVEYLDDLRCSSILSDFFLNKR